MHDHRELHCSDQGILCKHQIAFVYRLGWSWRQPWDMMKEFDDNIPARDFDNFQENNQYILMALGAFLDERGIHHPNVNVSRRESYLFMRCVKLLKAKLVPYIETILQSLQDTVAQFTRLNNSLKSSSGDEVGSHIFEAIGLLIGMENVSPEKQLEYLSSLLTPLCHQVGNLGFIKRFNQTCGQTISLWHEAK